MSELGRGWRPVPVAEGCSAFIQIDNRDIEARKPREIPVGHYALVASEIEAEQFDLETFIKEAVNDTELL